MKRRVVGIVAYCGLLGIVLSLGLTWTPAEVASRRWSALPDLLDQPVQERKLRFFRYLLPIVHDANDRVREQRRQLAQVRQHFEHNGVIDPDRRAFVEGLAEQYRVVELLDSPRQLLAELWVRVDVVPVTLALVQAAKESGWGTSRFARTANNLFGEWCFERGCGLVPVGRPRGAQHEVEQFDDPAAAVVSYIDNLNSHPTYAGLRAQRAELRRARQSVDGFALVNTLGMYSERRQAYVDEVRVMLRVNAPLIHQLRARGGDDPRG